MDNSEIDRQTLLKKLQNKESIEVIDLREKPEYDDWHISESTNLPVYNALIRRDFEPFIQQIRNFSTENELVFVCREGVTSKAATSLAMQLGYSAQSLIGGMRDWSNAWTVAKVELQNSDITFLQIRRDGKGCLSYLLGSAGNAAVFDPNIEANIYTKLAKENNLKIKWVFETHVHADHISRASELVRETGASLKMPEKSIDRVTIDFQPVHDNENFQIGTIDLRAINTPGHTGESTSYLINDEALLSGDTLFVESIGRPDLEKGDSGAEEGANQLFDSLHQRLLSLPESVRIFPAHYSGIIKFDGSPVTARMKDIVEYIDLLHIEKESFVNSVISSLPQKPPNHQMIIAINEGKSALQGPPEYLEAGPNRCAVQQ